MFQKIILAAFLAFNLGCMSKGFNRGELKEQIGVIKAQFDDKEIEAAFKKKPNLPKPFKLAVYFKTPASGFSIPKWRWTEEDKDVLDEVGKQLKSEGLVSDIFPIVSSVVTSEDLKPLRLAAAKHQADALLIISGATDIDRYLNKWGTSYILLVPALFVPGSEAETLFIANATLWDVKNEYLYLTAETEGITSETYVAVWGRNEKDMVNEAKQKAMEKLKSEIKKSLKGNKI